MKRYIFLLGILVSFGSASAVKVGAFDVKQYKDDLGDTVTMVSARNTDKDGASTIVFSCSSDGFEAYYNTGGYPFDASLDEIKTKYKFGTFQSSPSAYWSMATSHDALFVPDDLKSSFVKQAKTSTKLTVTILVGPSYGISNTESFNFTGFNKVVLKYLKCAK